MSNNSRRSVDVWNRCVCFRRLMAAATRSRKEENRKSEKEREREICNTVGADGPHVSRFLPRESDLNDIITKARY